ncbi:hypothetical protein FRC04_007564 [Tulasnella sp. 424]|nr:hypothetical protein FRC04_007564 [Tulasnella sp. 424]KAG8978999.1 hypothetical protein FRC05_009209 [Tulasnella sp. 425]
MSYPYTTYQYPQYTTITTQPASRTIAVASPTSAGVNRRATVRNLAPVNTAPQYSSGGPISSGVARSPTQVQHQRTRFAPLPTAPPLTNVPVVTRNGTRSRRSNSVNVPRQGNVDDYDPYPTRSATINYGSRIIGSQAPYTDFSFSARSRRATSAPPIHHPRRQAKQLEDFNVGSATGAGRLYDEPHLPLPYRDFSAGGRDTRQKGHRAETYGDRYGGPSSSSRGPGGGASGSGHKGGGGMFGWLVGHK